MLSAMKEDLAVAGTVPVQRTLAPIHLLIHLSIHPSKSSTTIYRGLALCQELCKVLETQQQTIQTQSSHPSAVYKTAATWKI